MSTWLDGLTAIQQLLLVVAVFSTAIFIIQLLLTLTGFAGDELDVDASADGQAFDLGDIFTIRNGVTFLMGLSWGGLMAYDWGLTHTAFVLTVGCLVGSFFVFVNIVLFLALSRLRYAGNIKLENAIDENATVTLPIPGNRSGVGKVNVEIQGRLKEYHAVTDGDALARNASVVVVDLTGNQLVVAGTGQQTDQ